ncbi:MAG TPA: LLM class F420-dependent oxidoreductase [Anaerolineaceae bacterium]|jgi:probable F420-dependent oxidoreductase|nr:LLM class F420-dependent oxidoreductase [Anaerolineaceae bacterium]
MKFGVVLPTYGKGATRLSILDTALAAEELGYDSIWVTDHLALPQEDAERFGHIFEAVTTLSYLAASTRQIRLGISALVLPQRNPLEIGKELATLDALSGGRVILAAGIGWSAGEYANLGYDFRNRGKRMDEALKVLRTLWRGGKVISFNGTYYRFEKVVLSPPPVQPGGPPIWVAGDSPVALKRAVYYADGWHPNTQPVEQIRAALESVRPLLLNRPFTVCMRARLQFSTEPEPGQTFSGTPEQIAGQLREYQQAGVDYVIFSCSAETQGERERWLKIFQAQVRPLVS